MGVTNPFFTKCLQHWPNIIKIAEVATKQPQQPIEEITNQLSSALGRSSSKIKKTSSIRVVDTQPAVYTHYESFLNKNKEILKSLIRVGSTI